MKDRVAIGFCFALVVVGIFIDRDSVAVIGALLLIALELEAISDHLASLKVKP